MQRVSWCHIPNHTVISSFLHDQRTPSLPPDYDDWRPAAECIEETPVGERRIPAGIREAEHQRHGPAGTWTASTARSRVYGAADTPIRRRFEQRGQFRFRQLSPEFVHDLAHCDRLVASAGHQLICEAHFFQKPLLAVPEPGQYEQHINAWYVQRNGLGMQCRADRLTR